MHEQARYSSGLGWIWALIGLIVIILLLLGAWLVLYGGKNDDPIFQACTDAYRKDNRRDAKCTCFAGILNVRLPRDARRAYVKDLDRSKYLYGEYDLRPNRGTFAPNDGRVCVDTSDICKVSACEPLPEYYPYSSVADGAFAPQSFERPYEGAPGTWGQRQ